MKKNPFQSVRRFFVRTRKYNTTAAARSAPMGYEEDDGNTTRLSGAFIIVLLLHIIAVVGVFAFARIKENRRMNTAPEVSTQVAATKTAKPAAPKAPAAAAVIPDAVAKPVIPPGETIKSTHPGMQATHVVRDGETATKIAFAYNIGLADLVTANKLKDANEIRPGQPLVIPEARQLPKAAPAADSKLLPATATKPATTASTASTVKAPTPSLVKATRTYVVRKGDSAVKIAREHGCSYETLVKLNNIKDPKKIQPGQVLKLPSKNG